MVLDHFFRSVIRAVHTWQWVLDWQIGDWTKHMRTLHFTYFRFCTMLWASTNKCLGSGKVADGRQRRKRGGARANWHRRELETSTKSRTHSHSQTLIWYFNGFLFANYARLGAVPPCTSPDTRPYHCYLLSPFEQFLTESFVTKITALVVRHWLLDPRLQFPSLVDHGNKPNPPKQSFKKLLKNIAV